MGSDGRAVGAELRELDASIDACRQCEREVGHGYVKIQGLRRGEPGRVMVVGQGPGNKESTTRAAFAGHAGKMLDRWLIACGASSTDPRKGIYLTSLVKCIAPPNALAYRRMVRNCRPFLARQIGILRPHLIITLGKPAYEWFREGSADFTEALCNAFQSSSNPLLARWGGSYDVMPWPHPSPANNRVLSSPDIQAKMERSFQYVRPFLEHA